MGEKKFINIMDFGMSKIRFSVFDKELNQQYSNIKTVKYDKDYLYHTQEITSIIKKAEKKISMHIKDVVLSLDHENMFTIDLSFRRDFDSKIKISKIYHNLVLELEQTLNSYYNEFEIIHIILNKCIIDSKTYLDLPKDIKINNIKVDFKVICFPKKIISYIRSILNKVNVQILNFFCTSYVKSLSYLRKLSLEKASFLEIGYKRTNFIF